MRYRWILLIRLRMAEPPCVLCGDELTNGPETVQTTMRSFYASRVGKRDCRFRAEYEVQSAGPIFLRFDDGNSVRAL